MIDASVLAGALKRNVVLSLAEAGFFRPRWSAQILDEVERAIGGILRRRDDADPEGRAKRHRLQIEAAFPDACVDNFDSLIAGLTLPDPDDRHVLAAAIRTSASVLVTDNGKDFPTDVLQSFAIQRVDTDAFVADILDLDPVAAVSALRTMRKRFARPEIDAETLIRKLEAVGLTSTANLLLDEKPNL